MKELPELEILESELLTTEEDVARRRQELIDSIVDFFGFQKTFQVGMVA